MSKFTEVNTVLVSSDPESLTATEINYANVVLSKIGLRYKAVRRLDEFLPHVDKSIKMIIVGNKWNDISIQCIEAGLEPNTDFFPIWSLDLETYDLINYNKMINCTDLQDRLNYIKRSKKIACVFGNCQTRPIAELIAHAKDFMKDHMLIKMPFVQSIDIKVAAEGFNEVLLKNLDLFISMHILEDNKFSIKVSTKYIKDKLSNDCQIVIIPNCYFTAYYPQIAAFKTDYLPYFIKPPFGKILSYNDCYAETAVKNDTSITHPTKEQIIDNLEKTIVEMITRENKCDITISDYILSNYKDRRIFYSRSHPTTDVLKEEVRRLMIHLGYTGEIEDGDIFKLDRYKEYIYPEVFDTLGLSFTDPHSYINKSLSEESFDDEMYLALLKLYKQPDYWRKTIRWISQPMRKSIDFSSNIAAMDGVRITSRILALSSALVQLSLTFVTTTDIGADCGIVKIPSCIAPSYEYITTGQHQDGSIVKIKIRSNGLISSLSDILKDMEVQIETTWLL